MTFNELVTQVNAQLTAFATQVGNDITSSNITSSTSFVKGVGVYVNSPDSPWTSGIIPLTTTGAVKGGICSIWYKGPVLTKSSFTGGTIVMFSGVNVLNELCRVFIDYDKANNAFGVNIQTGFTGDLPSGPGISFTAPVITVTDPTISFTAPTISVTD